jgi:hypothetical protein
MVAIPRIEITNINKESLMNEADLVTAASRSGGGKSE